MNFCNLIFITFVLIYKIDSGKIRPNFDEIFGEEWNKNECEGKVIKIEQNELNENSQSAAVDQMGEEMGTDPIGQMSEYSNQNIIKSDQNSREDTNDEQKRKMIQNFEAIKEKLKQKGKYQRKNSVEIERKIAKLLGASRDKIYKWKKELNLNKRKIKIMKNSFYEAKKREFIERFVEFKSLYGQIRQKEFAKELGICKDTFWKWKKELLPKYIKTPNKYTNEDKLQKMKQYLKIKKRKPTISDRIIAKKLEIGKTTLNKWKKKFASVL